MPEATPMVKQYKEIKSNHKDSILFFRLGDFYEMFYDDAVLASRELELTLTGRGKGEGRMPMCGIPHHASKNYIQKLIEKGYKVAICEQVEDPSVTKGIVKRDVVKIYTPGTVIESSMLYEKTNNYLMAIAFEKNKYGIAYVDASTGEFKITQVDSEHKVKEEIDRINPSELLVSDLIEHFESGSVSLTCFKDKYDFESASEKLKEHFKISNLESFGVEDFKVGIEAAAAILDYLSETQKTSLSHINKIQPYSVGEFMFIDSATRRNLELVNTAKDKSYKGSLLWVLDQTKTSMGSRMLRSWVLQPLLNVSEINNRLDSVEELFSSSILREDLGKHIREISDIERLTAKVAAASCNARDLVALKESLNKLPAVSEVLNGCKTDLLKPDLDLESGRQLSAFIQGSIVDDPPFAIKDAGIIKIGYNPELDEIKKAARGGKQWLSELETKERQRTGIKSLKVSFNKVFGYYIDVTKSNLSQVPADYIRKQTLVNSERYITPELKDKEALILNADERLKKMEYEIFCQIRDEVAKYTVSLQQIAYSLAQIDCLLSLAEVAVSGNYCKPAVSRELLAVSLKQSRHPVVEKTQGEHKFVPNDVELNDNQSFLLITGPNMGGKCVSSDTLVFTDKGLFPICKFNSPEMKDDEFKPFKLFVKGLKGKEKTSHFYKGGLQKIIRIKTRTGFTIEGTKNHRIIVRNEKGQNLWKRLDEIIQSDYLVIDRNINLWGNKTRIGTFKSSNHHNMKKYNYPKQMTEDLAYFIGLLIGDGTITYREYTAFSNCDIGLINSFKNICFSIFGKKAMTKKNKKDHMINSLFIREFLYHLGLRYWNSKNKEVPNSILCASKKIIRAFLRGFFDTDGYASNVYGTPSCSTSSYRLARQIQMLLLNFGLICHFRTKKTKRADNFILTLYGINGKKFYEKIGFGLKRKQNRKNLMPALRMTNVEVIPYLKDRLLKLQRQIVESRNIPSKSKLKYAKKINGIFYSYIRQNRNLSYDKLRQLVIYCNKCKIDCADIEELLRQYYFYDKISIIVAGESPVYDFTVPGSHSFVANGIINHNSTYMRQVALICLMAQIGAYVPAEIAELCPVDRIFTRIGAMDDIFSGQSTFMLEMTETANIINNATDKSLIILDEIGRGTATFDGMSIAAAVAEYIHTKIKAKTMFATHYHEITQLADKYNSMQNLNVSVIEKDDHIVFLHKIKEGTADKSYGIQVAKLAGLPDSVISRSKEIYNTLEMVEKGFGNNQKKSLKKEKSGCRMTNREQMGLF